MKIRSRLLFLALTLAMHGCFFYFSFDLEQRNKETLFLSESDLKAYWDFQKKIDEPVYLAVRWKKDASTNKDFHALVSQIQSKYPHIHIVDPQGVFAALGELPLEWKTAMSSLVQKAVPFRMDERYFSLIFSFSTDEELEQKHAFITFLQNQSLAFSVSPEFVGLPYTNHLLDTYAEQIKSKVFPILFGACLFICFFVTKSIWSGVLVFLPPLFSLVQSLVTIGFFFNDLNMVTSIAPILLFVLNLALSFHLYFAFVKEKSLHAVRKKKTLPIFLTLITTMIGFGSLIVSDIEAIRQFAVVSTLGILISFTHNLIWFAFLFPLGRHRLNDHLFTLIPKKLATFTPPTYVSFFICTLGLLLGGLLYDEIKIETNAIHYFPKSSHLTSQIQRLEKEFLGSPNFEILIDLPTSMSRTDFQNKIVELEEKLTQRMQSGYRSVGSGSIHTLLALMEGIGVEESVLSNFSDHYPMAPARITLFGASIEAKRYFHELALIEALLKENDIHHFMINGLYYNLMRSQKTLLNVLFQSFSISLFLIAVISFMAFRHVSIFLIYIIVNLAPVGFTFSVMMLCDLSLNVATVMTFSVSLGIIVDSSFHLTHHLFQGEDSESFYRLTKLPIFVSSIALIIGFSLFATNEFLPIKQFGLNLAITLAFGLLFDAYLLPSLLKMVRKKPRR